MFRIAPFLPRTRIAYFSMEIAMRPEMHTYSGGLGVLAGDTVRSSADLSLPMVFVTLASREGYLRQRLTEAGDQIAEPDPWEPADWCTPLDAMIALPLGGRKVWVRPWLHVHRRDHGGEIPVLLLDTDVDQNDTTDRDITDRLYGGDDAYRLKQEIVLGIGGLEILGALGFEIETYHLNEGHAALLAAAVLCRYSRPDDDRRADGLGFDVNRVRDRCVFTTHTPVEAGHDQFDQGLTENLLGDLLPVARLRVLAGHERFNMTRLALSLSGYVNGVAERHAATTQRMYPEVRIHEVTNGVHLGYWVHPKKAALFDQVSRRWRHEPEDLVTADLIDDDALAATHSQTKGDLIEEIARRSGRQFDPNLPILAFARRMTGYKRPDLVFSDLERLRGIGAARPFQLVMAGKAHPADRPGQDLIREAHDHMRHLEDQIPMVFLPDYDLALAQKLVSGADIWLNTPLPPYEASGTSGMKAAANGVLNLSVLDGWWLEGWVEGVTGWAIGVDHDDPAEHAIDLYDKLEHAVLPLWYDDKTRWLGMMKASMAKIGSRFNSHRMMRRYASEAYLR
jgi:starch phosphorylase